MESSIKPVRHCLCSCNKNIYIIDGQKGEIIEFNPSSKTFTKMICIDKIGALPSAVVMNDEIHIYNGYNNNKSIAYIYHPQNNTIQKINDQFASQQIENRCLLMMNDRRRLVWFGGVNAIGHNKAYGLVFNEQK